MIRLTAESSAFFQGAGWQSYQNYIGAEIFYPEYTNEIRREIVTGHQRTPIEFGIDDKVLDVVNRISGARYRQGLSDFEAKKVRKITPLQVYYDDTVVQMKRILDRMMAEMSSRRTLKYFALVVTHLADLSHSLSIIFSCECTIKAFTLKRPNS